ncbi:MAG: phosphate ABC transporter permease subunit PstC [Elusimicrobiota bacterium]
MTLFKSSTSSHYRSDFILGFFLKGAACISGVIIFIISWYLIKESIPVLKAVSFLRFFTDSGWFPTEGLFNTIPMLTGTLLATMLSVLIATPLGIASALFCHYYAPKPISKIYRSILEVMAGIPSVVYGFWGLVVLVPIIGSIRPPGSSLLAGSLILVVMILPTLALMLDGTLSHIPTQYIQGAASLGLSRWGMIRHVILPASKSGMITGVILQTGRAIGETMAILMVCGNVVQNPKSIFDPIRTLTSNIALEMAYASGSHRSALFVSGLILMGLIVLLVGAAEIISHEHIYEEK